jgi:hypothetical protein
LVKGAREGGEGWMMKMRARAIEVVRGCAKFDKVRANERGEARTKGGALGSEEVRGGASSGRGSGGSGGAGARRRGRGDAQQRKGEVLFTIDGDRGGTREEARQRGITRRLVTKNERSKGTGFSCLSL